LEVPPEKAFTRDPEEKRRGLSTLEIQVEDQNKLIINYIGKRNQTPTKANLKQSNKDRFSKLNQLFGFY
jgi:hypothetical protein